MLIVALVMAVIGLAALVTAVVTSNQIIAWVCIGASVIGVILLIVDALRERRQRDITPTEPAEEGEADREEFDAEYPEDKEDKPEESEDETETVDSSTERSEKTND